MHKLVTIDDLDQPQEVKTPLIERARQLSRYFEQYKAQDNGGYTYTVEVAGSKERAPGIHASEISKCQRLLVYSIQGVERKKAEGDTVDVNMQMRFNVGHAVHGMLQNDMTRMCEWVNTASGGVVLTYEPEVRIHPGLGGNAEQWGAHSACDGVFVFVHQGEAYLRVGHEIKTQSAPMYEKNTRPQDDHYEQTTLYMAALDVPLMWIQYYNKSNSYFTPSDPPYLFQFDTHLWERQLEVKFAKSQHQAETGQLPDREEGRHCRWCPFSWTCQPPSLNKQRYGPSTTAQSPGALRR
jgi:CRISPR/Cas system-associated exonuclease Cas4 (RecB family)